LRKLQLFVSVLHTVSVVYMEAINRDSTKVPGFRSITEKYYTNYICIHAVKSKWVHCSLHSATQFTARHVTKILFIITEMKNYSSLPVDSALYKCYYLGNDIRQR